MIRMIAAIDGNGGLARQGVIPWDIPTDRRYFRKQTMRFGGSVIMGRKTYESIGKPLHNRHAIVVSSQMSDFPEVVVISSLIDFLSTTQDDVWVIGGGEIYRQALAFADELYITHVEGDYDCDTFFPDFISTFTLKRQSKAQHENGYTFTFAVYSR